MTSFNNDWNLLRVFLCVMAHRNLTHAARELGLSQPTIGRNIEALEKDLGYNLFIRTSKGLNPTKAAFDLLPIVESMHFNAQTFARIAHSVGHEMKGCIRISASEIVAIEILPKILANISLKFPDIEFEIVASDNVSDLVGRDADIAIRMVRPNINQLLINNIGKLQIGAFASHEFLKINGKPKTIEEILNYKIIGFDTLFPYLRAYSEKFKAFSREKFSFRADSSLVQLALIKSGAGVGFSQVGIGKNNNLVQILEDEISIEIDIYLAMHINLKSQSRYINIFRELGHELKQYLKLSRQ